MRALSQKVLGLVLAGVMGTAVAAEAVQEASFTDAQGNNVVVVTADDGTVLVSVNGGEYVSGAQALDALKNAGITLSVAPKGQIVAVRAAQGTKVVDQPRPASSQSAQRVKNATENAQQANEQARPAVTPIANFLPANVPASSGTTGLSFEKETHSTVDTQSVSK